jgi:hypothetical protein
MFERIWANLVDVIEVTAIHKVPRTAEGCENL